MGSTYSLNCFTKTMSVINENMGSADSGYEGLVPANSGAIVFQVKSPTGSVRLDLLTSHHKLVYTINLGRCSRVNEYSIENRYADYDTEFIELRGQFQEFWACWFNDAIRVGHSHSTVPFIDYGLHSHHNKMIGYIRFDKDPYNTTEWIYKMPPKVEAPLPVKIKGNELRWVTMTDDDRVPPDALIGGFENEPIYIACATHNGSLCPGKYVPSKRLAYVPWGGREHIKKEFKILCGYNATWVQTFGNRIPRNAYVGGKSELRGEPLFIGRTVHNGHLINGKVHVIYSTCYVPYCGKECEYHHYEILVLPNTDTRA